MALIKCPECGKEISDKAAACIHCGCPLDNANPTPESKYDTSEPKESVNNAPQKTKVKQLGILKVALNKINAINPTVRLVVSFVLIIAAVICLVQGKNTLTDDRYAFYKEHYQDCMDGYEESINSARTAGYMFRSTYESIAESYKEMAEDDLSEINGYRVKAIIFYALFAIFALATFVFLSGIDFKKTFAHIVELVKQSESFETEIQPETKSISESEIIEVTQSDAHCCTENQIIGDVENDNEIIDNAKNSSEVQEKFSSLIDGIKPHMRKIIVIIGIAVAGIVLLTIGTTIFDKEYCEVEGCNRETFEGEHYCVNHLCCYVGCSNRAIDDGLYCYSHTCKVSGCNERIARESYGQVTTEYCQEHQSIYDSAVSTSNLTISDKKIEHNSSYTVFTATMTNNSAATYEFVTVKGSFTDENGNVCDTDSTYAVGGEGLAPGESTSFRMSIPKDRSVEGCNITIIDYDVVRVNTSLIEFD